MSEETLAPELLDFIGLCTPTVPHLEALLLIWETAPKPWAAEEIAARIYVTEDATSKILRDLERCGIVEKDATQPTSFHYDARNQWDATLPLIAQTYRCQLSRVARYIHSQGSKSLREFSRAFTFRRKQ